MNDRHKRVMNRMYYEHPWWYAARLVNDGFRKGMSLTLPEVTKAVAMLSGNYVKPIKRKPIKWHKSNKGWK